MNIELYTKQNCSYCVKAKALLEKLGHDYTTIDVSAGSIDDQVLAREKLIDRVVELTGDAPRTMPQIIIDGKHIGGYKEMANFFYSED